MTPYKLDTGDWSDWVNVIYEGEMCAGRYNYATKLWQVCLTGSIVIDVASVTRWQFRGSRIDQWNM